MYLYIGGIGKRAKTPLTPQNTILLIYRPPIPPCVYDFLYGGGGMDVMCEGRRLNLTIGQLFCQQFFKISIFWR